MDRTDGAEALRKQFHKRFAVRQNGHRYEGVGQRNTTLTDKKI